MLLCRYVTSVNQALEVEGTANKLLSQSSDTTKKKRRSTSDQIVFISQEPGE